MIHPCPSPLSCQTEQSTHPHHQMELLTSQQFLPWSSPSASPLPSWLPHCHQKLHPSSPAASPLPSWLPHCHQKLHPSSHHPCSPQMIVWTHGRTSSPPESQCQS